MNRARGRALIVGNWKMHKMAGEGRAFAEALLSRSASLTEAVELVVCPPFTALAAVAEVLREGPIALGAQTMHQGEFGPFTGEISAPMLRELGVRYVVLGHSERRAFCGETDSAVNAKVHAALRFGLVPIIAVGETADEHAQGLAHERVRAQTRAAFAGVGADAAATCVVAYEPIWAIGSGLVDEPYGAARTIGGIRAAVPGLERARVLYGGSMKPANAAALFAEEPIDGGLVGGASLELESFIALAAAARHRLPL
ncbi:MAG: triose-phosphate isomerase [Vulcanimicrobiaceae bacterium]